MILNIADLSEMLQEERLDLEKINKPYSEHVCDVLENSEISRQRLFGHLHQELLKMMLLQNTILLQSKTARKLQ